MCKTNRLKKQPRVCLIFFGILFLAFLSGAEGIAAELFLSEKFCKKIDKLPHVKTIRINWDNFSKAKIEADLALVNYEHTCSVGMTENIDKNVKEANSKIAEMKLAYDLLMEKTGASINPDGKFFIGLKYLEGDKLCEPSVPDYAKNLEAAMKAITDRNEDIVKKCDQMKRDQNKSGPKMSDLKDTGQAKMDPMNSSNAKSSGREGPRRPARFPGGTKDCNINPTAMSHCDYAECLHPNDDSKWCSVEEGNREGDSSNNDPKKYEPGVLFKPIN